MTCLIKSNLILEWKKENNQFQCVLCCSLMDCCNKLILWSGNTLFWSYCASVKPLFMLALHLC